MNYLAHMFLSDNTPGSMLGNFMGDFIKGSAEGEFPREIVEGIIHHRRIDHLYRRSRYRFIQQEIDQRSAMQVFGRLSLISCMTIFYPGTGTSTPKSVWMSLSKLCIKT